MPKFLKNSLLAVCFIVIMTTVSLTLPPGFLLPKPEGVEKTAEVVSLTAHPEQNACLIVFDFEGEKLEISDPLPSCTKYSVGEKVKV